MTRVTADISDGIAEASGHQPGMVLNQAYRLTVFVPPEHLEPVLRSVQAEVSLQYGPYRNCAWWSSQGTEQYEPLPGSSPTFGEIGKIERVPTVRLEIIVPPDAGQLGKALRAIVEAHPWQEPAILIDTAMVTGSLEAVGDGQ